MREIVRMCFMDIAAAAGILAAQIVVYWIALPG